MTFKRWRPAVALLAGASLLLAACADTEDDNGADESTGTPVPEITAPVTGTPAASPDPAGGGGIEPANPDSPPEGTLASSGDSVELGLGSYCWSPPTSSGQPALCADAIGVITAPDDLVVEPGETLTIAGEAGTLPWPPMMIANATLWLADGEPVMEEADFRAWHPQDDAVTLETHEEIGEHSIVLPDDLEAGTYVLTIQYTAGPDRGSDATYGAVLVVE